MTRYGLIFLSIAFLCGLAAAQLHGSAFGLVAWLAGGFVMIAAAYLTESPELFGKRPNGTIAPWAITLAMPVLLLNYALWYLMRRARDEATSNEVAPDIHVGGLPWPHDLPADTATIVDLTSEFIAHAEIRRHPGYRSFPMLDDGFAKPARIEQIVAQLVDRPGPMLIHCAAGHGRSATLAAAIGIARGHFDNLDHAEAQMQLARPKIRFQPQQRERLAQWLELRGPAA